MAFDEAAVWDLRSRISSIARQIFESVITHESKSAPGPGVVCEIVFDRMQCLGPASGLSASSGRVAYTVRVRDDMKSEPQDDLDNVLLSVTAQLTAALCADFTLGGTIRNIDVYGAYGDGLKSDAGYINQDNNNYRVISTTVPCIVNDMYVLGS